MKCSPLSRIGRVRLRADFGRQCLAKFASAPDDAMEAAGRDQILAQVLMTEAEHADQSRDQSLASAWHVTGARIGPANMRTERTPQSVPVLS